MLNEESKKKAWTPSQSTLQRKKVVKKKRHWVDVDVYRAINKFKSERFKVKGCAKNYSKNWVSRAAFRSEKAVLMSKEWARHD